MRPLASVAVCLLVSAGLTARVAAETPQESFAKLKREVKFGPVEEGADKAFALPYLTWGGDVATFHANGGLETTRDSLFGKLGLKFKLTQGDDFLEQVRQYVSGRTPYLRGTISQLGQASEALGIDARCRPVVFLQLTWSQGDHMVARSPYKTLNDLNRKQVKIALQSGGPHVGMLDDVLRTAGIGWKDVEIVWTKDVTGKGGPAELFRKDKSIDACFVISPDMQGLTGGLDKTGSGAEGTVKGARVLVSTASLTRSIADVYACRKDYFDKHKESVEKLAAGYLKACEELRDAKDKAAKKDARAVAEYKRILGLARTIYGKDVLASDADADGLVSDANFVGLPGNRAFFKDTDNPSGFKPRMDAALRLAIDQGYASRRAEFLPPLFIYAEIKRVGGLTAKVGQPRRKFTGKEELGDPIFTFAIAFERNDPTFQDEQYKAHFKRAVEEASKWGKTVITVRGHADTAKFLKDFVRAGVALKVLRREGEAGKRRYILKGFGQLDLNDPKTLRVIAQRIAKDDFKGAPSDPQGTLEDCRKLSQHRANAVFAALLKYAEERKLELDKKQIKPVGLSLFEPVVPAPRSDADTASNRRVEFRIYKLKYNAEAARKDSKDNPYDY